MTSVPKFNTEHSEVCKECALGKYVKTTFPSSDSKPGGVLDLIHSNLCGSMSTISLKGYECYITFIDDFSRKKLDLFFENQGIKRSLTKVRRVQTPGRKPNKEKDQNFAI